MLFLCFLLICFPTVPGTIVDYAKSAHAGGKAQMSHNGYEHWGCKTQYQGLSCDYVTFSMFFYSCNNV